MLASQDFLERILSNPDWRDRTKSRNVLILRGKIKAIFLRHCWEIAVTQDLQDLKFKIQALTLLGIGYGEIKATDLLAES